MDMELDLHHRGELSAVKDIHDVLMTEFNDIEPLCADILKFSIEVDINDPCYQFSEADRMVKFCAQIPFKLPGIVISARHMSPHVLVDALRKLGPGTNAINIRGDFYKQCIFMECDSVAELLNMNHASLKELDLRENALTDDSVMEMVNALANNTSLESLYLGYNALGTKSVKKIAEVVAGHTSLRHLDLSFLRNRETLGTLDKEAVIAMANAFGANTSLQSAFWPQWEDPMDFIGLQETKVLQDAMRNASMKRLRANLPDLHIRHYGREIDILHQSLYTLLKQLHPDLGILEEVSSHVKDKVLGVLDKVAFGMASSPSENVLDCVNNAMKAVISGVLQKHALSEVAKTYQFASRYRPFGATVTIDVGAIAEHLAVNVPQMELKEEAVVLLSAMVEYLAAEILELSGNATRDRLGKELGHGANGGAESEDNISLADVNAAIKADAELNELWN